MNPQGGSKREFLHLVLPFIASLQVIIDTSNLVCGLNIGSPSLPMTERQNLISAAPNLFIRSSQKIAWVIKSGYLPSCYILFRLV